MPIDPGEFKQRCDSRAPNGCCIAAQVQIRRLRAQSRACRKAALWRRLMQEEIADLNQVLGLTKQPAVTDNPIASETS